MRTYRNTVLCAFVALGTTVVSTVRADEIATTMADAATRLITTLDDTQKAEALFTFDSPERFNWHWIPRPRKGLPFKALRADQRALAFSLLNTGLSTKGQIRAATIMSLEEILRVAEHGTGPVRDSELYFVSVFGTPSEEGEWAWRIEGHHLALNFTLKGGKVIGATPFMFGSNPATVQSGPRRGLRNLSDIEKYSTVLLKSLSPEQLKEAIVEPVAPEVTTTPNSAQAQVSTPRGVSSDSFTEEQRDTLKKLYQAYVLNFAEPIRAELLDQHDKIVHFAWFGDPNVAKNHAFTLQGSSFFIDFNDTQNDVNHIHTFFRSLVGDFGQHR
jgi:Protein of unknown function (DUF3500)